RSLRRRRVAMHLATILGRQTSGPAPTQLPHPSFVSSFFHSCSFGRTTVVMASPTRTPWAEGRASPASASIVGHSGVGGGLCEQIGLYPRATRRGLGHS